MPATGAAVTVNVFEAEAVPQEVVTVYLITTLPAPTAITIPVEGSTVAALVLLLLHTPPASPLLVNVEDVPTHVGAVPLIVPAFGAALTVIDFVAEAEPHALLAVYVIVALPAATPVTTPVDAFTVATLVLSLLQVPPDVPPVVNAVDEPAHTVDAPLIVPATGAAVTVNVFKAEAVPQLLVTV